MGEVPEWLLFDQQDVHDTLVATSKHKPHLIADMAAMANVPGLANGQARRPVVLQTQQFASQVSQPAVSNLLSLANTTKCQISNNRMHLHDGCKCQLSG